ncbi:superoxide dismutase family protein [Ruminococcus sp.]|uniref:superoxide dismutase family protein n=1 Tax=Ruminococcus sp. TaxID=41978 RepID=UPI0025DA4E39|nr:superoxide dismutase family protein [Ruminococcus sp.]
MNRIYCSGVSLIQKQPQAAAVLTGSHEYPDIYGVVRFYTTKKGTLVYADVNGLPYAGNRCSQEVFGFHIHEGESCTGNTDDPFADAGTHLNKDKCGHPFHTGDAEALPYHKTQCLSIPFLEFLQKGSMHKTKSLSRGILKKFSVSPKHKTNHLSIVF